MVSIQIQQSVPYGRPGLFLALANSISHAPQKITEPPRPPPYASPPPYAPLPPNASPPYVNKQEKNIHWCGCYRTTSTDARCCGLCYYCCPTPNVNNQCNFCPNNINSYCNSGYIITQTTGQPERWDDCDCCCTLVCLPLKFSCFFPCFFGSICNNCINYMRDTDFNYLC